MAALRMVLLEFDRVPCEADYYGLDGACDNVEQDV